MSGDVDYNDGMLVNTPDHTYFPFAKVSDDTNGVVGKSINEQSATTAFHGRNENTTAMKFHQMNFKNFDLKPRLEIETGNVVARKENIMHNFLAFARRYHYIVLLSSGESLINPSSSVRVLNENCRTQFIDKASTLTDTATIALINSSLKNTKTYTQEQFFELVSNRVESMYDYAKRNREYRNHIITEIFDH